MTVDKQTLTKTYLKEFVLKLRNLRILYTKNTGRALPKAYLLAPPDFYMLWQHFDSLNLDIKNKTPAPTEFDGVLIRHKMHGNPELEMELDDCLKVLGAKQTLLDQRKVVPIR